MSPGSVWRPDPLVGGVVTEGLDWHWIFWVNVPLGIAAVVAVLRVLPETYGPRTRLDPLGMVDGLRRDGRRWCGVCSARRTPAGGPPRSLVALALGVALLVGFVAWESVAPAPMVPLSLFRLAGVLGRRAAPSS